MTFEEALRQSRFGRVVYHGPQAEMHVEVRGQNLVRIEIGGVSEGTMTPRDAGELARQLGIPVNQGWEPET